MGLLKLSATIAVIGVLVIELGAVAINRSRPVTSPAPLKTGAR